MLFKQFIDGFCDGFLEEEFIADGFPTIIDLLGLFLVDCLAECMLGSCHHCSLGDVTNPCTFNLVHVCFTEGKIDLGSALFWGIFTIKYSPDVVQGLLVLHVVGPTAFSK